jgi:hypothetical protein
MIKLKNGFEVPYNKDFDEFYKNLMESIIRESHKSISSPDPGSDKSASEIFLKEIMDNCIYVTHQLFEIAKEREDFSRFIITGFLFNSIICSLPSLGGTMQNSEPGDKDNIH